MLSLELGDSVGGAYQNGERKRKRKRKRKYHNKERKVGGVGLPISVQRFLGELAILNGTELEGETGDRAEDWKIGCSVRDWNETKIS